MNCRFHSTVLLLWSKGWFALDAAVCIFRSGLHQCKDRKFSISLQKCNCLPQTHVQNALMWMNLKKCLWLGLDRTQPIFFCYCVVRLCRKISSDWLKIVLRPLLTNLSASNKLNHLPYLVSNSFHFCRICWSAALPTDFGVSGLIMIFLNGPSSASFIIYFWSFRTSIIIIYNNIWEKFHTVFAFEPTTSWTWFSSHNH